MFGSAAFEVAIGLVLVFLLMSLIMTAVQEALQGFFSTRAKTLEKALLEILQGDTTMRDAFYNHPLIYALYRGQHAPAGAQPPPTPAQLPSYIPRETFAAALIDLMDGASTPAGKPLQQAMDSLKKAAGADATALRREVESWYDAAMDRASGSFKRRSQASLFILGLGVAVLLNVNAIVIAQYLSVSPQQRQLVTAIAEKAISAQPAPSSLAQPTVGRPAGSPTVPAGAPGNTAAPAGTPGNSVAPAAAPGSPGAQVNPPPLLTSEQVRTLTDELTETGLPFGWSPASRSWIERGFPGGHVVLFQGPFSPAAALAWLLLLTGYLVTAFAVMLGAPFWFDVLNKFMVIRATVKPREKSPDEASEDRGGGRTGGQGS